jgi:hypothetical protein
MFSNILRCHKYDHKLLKKSCFGILAIRLEAGIWVAWDLMESIQTKSIPSPGGHGLEQLDRGQRQRASERSNAFRLPRAASAPVRCAASHYLSRTGKLARPPWQPRAY